MFAPSGAVHKLFYFWANPLSETDKEGNALLREKPSTAQPAWRHCTASDQATNDCGHTKRTATKLRDTIVASFSSTAYENARDIEDKYEFEVMTLNQASLRHYTQMVRVYQCRAIAHPCKSDVRECRGATNNGGRKKARGTLSGARMAQFSVRISLGLPGTEGPRRRPGPQDTDFARGREGARQRVARWEKYGENYLWAIDIES